jgi:hypothetical protein
MVVPTIEQNGRIFGSVRCAAAGGTTIFAQSRSQCGFFSPFLARNSALARPQISALWQEYFRVINRDVDSYIKANGETHWQCKR